MIRFARLAPLGLLLSHSNPCSGQTQTEVWEISTKGPGDTKPAAPNATAEGRAQNRRVEVVRQ